MRRDMEEIIIKDIRITDIRIRDTKIRVTKSINRISRSSKVVTSKVVTSKVGIQGSSSNIRVEGNSNRTRMLRLRLSSRNFFPGSCGS